MLLPKTSVPPVFLQHMQEDPVWKAAWDSKKAGWDLNLPMETVLPESITNAATRAQLDELAVALTTAAARPEHKGLEELLKVREEKKNVF